MKRLWSDVVELTEFSLDESRLSLLEGYRDWLITEAIPAGGLGSAEESRLEIRHIADSLLFATPLDSTPSDIVDLGSGVGLPGIPLAILWPETRVCLVDRSGRRAELARRACRVLGIDNVEVVQTDIDEMSERFPVIVSRATMPPELMSSHVRRLLEPGGTAILGGSWTSRPLVKGWEAREIPLEMLDRTVWLLIMRRE